MSDLDDWRARDPETFGPVHGFRVEELPSVEAGDPETLIVLSFLYGDEEEPGELVLQFNPVDAQSTAEAIWEIVTGRTFPG